MAELPKVKVDQAVTDIQEGEQIILTLKDTDVLADGLLPCYFLLTYLDDDVLENVNIAENVRRERAHAAATKKRGYRGYDDEFAGEKSNMLSKYDEDAAPKVH